MDSASSRLSIKAATLSMLFMVPSISAFIIRGPSCGGCDTVTGASIYPEGNKN